MARPFQSSAAMMSIKTQPIIVEAQFSMTFVKRYHTPLRRAYQILRKIFPDIDQEEALQYAVKAINDSVGPDGPVPTLLVYGALPRLRLPTDMPAVGTMQRAVAGRKAFEAMSRYILAVKFETPYALLMVLTFLTSIMHHVDHMFWYTEFEVTLGKDRSPFWESKYYGLIHIMHTILRS